MITGILLNETVSFISKFDKGESKTIWKIKPLVTDKYLQVTKKLGADGEDSVEVLFDVAKTGLVGVENFKDKNGNDIVFSETIIDNIPRKVVVEIGTEVLKLSELSEEEGKN